MVSLGWQTVEDEGKIGKLEKWLLTLMRWKVEEKPRIGRIFVPFLHLFA